jgi:hypothetical protein
MLLDPFQFAYQPSRGVDDAILTLLNMVYRLLEGAKSHVRVLFVDLPSAFNTNQPYILAETHSGLLLRCGAGFVAVGLPEPTVRTGQNRSPCVGHTQQHKLSSGMCFVPTPVHLVH